MRVDQQDLGVRREFVADHHDRRMRDALTLLVQDTLGRPGGAACVADEEVVFAGDVHLRFGCILLREPALVLGGGVARLDDDHLPERRHLARFGQLLRVFLLHENQ